MEIITLECGEFCYYEWEDISYSTSSFTNFIFDTKRVCLVDEGVVLSFVEIVRHDSWCGYENKPLYAITAIATKNDQKRKGYAKLVLDETFSQLKDESEVIISSYSEDGENYIADVVQSFMDKYGITEATAR